MKTRSIISTAADTLKRQKATANRRGDLSAPPPRVRIPTRLLSGDATDAIAWGDLPDLGPFALDLFQAVQRQQAPASALPFMPILKKIPAKHLEQIVECFGYRESNMVLVQNEWLKALIIYWEAGKSGKVHGHPKGGCVFSVLKGKLLEKRYSPEPDQSLLSENLYSKGSLAYIDDTMAYHAVENPYAEWALSIHVYTPGK